MAADEELERPVVNVLMLYQTAEKELTDYLTPQLCKPISLLYRALCDIEEELDALDKKVFIDGILRQLQQMPVQQAVALALVVVQGDQLRPLLAVDMEKVYQELKMHKWLEVYIPDTDRPRFELYGTGTRPWRTTSVDILHVLLWNAVVRTNDKFNVAHQSKYPQATCQLKPEWHKGVGGCPKGYRPEGGCCFRLDYVPATAGLWSDQYKSTAAEIQGPRNSSKLDRERLEKVVFPSEDVRDQSLRYVGEVTLALIESAGEIFTAALAAEGECDLNHSSPTTNQTGLAFFVRRLWNWMSLTFTGIRDHVWTQTVVRGVRYVGQGLRSLGRGLRTTGEWAWNITVYAYTIGQKVATYIFSNPTVALYILSTAKFMMGEFSKWLGASFGTSVFGQALERSLHPLPNDSFQYSSNVVKRMRDAMALKIRYEDFAYAERFGLWNVLTHAMEGGWGHYVVRAAQLLAPVLDAFGNPDESVPDTPEGRNALDARLRISTSWWDQALFYVKSVPTRAQGTYAGSNTQAGVNLVVDSGAARRLVAWGSEKLAESVAGASAAAAAGGATGGNPVAAVAAGRSAAAAAGKTAEIIHKFIYAAMIVSRVNQLAELLVNAVFGILSGVMQAVEWFADAISFGYKVGSNVIAPIRMALDYGKAPFLTVLTTVLVTVLLTKTESWLVSLELLDNISLLLELLNFNNVLSSAQLGLRTMCPRLYLHCAMQDTCKMVWQSVRAGTMEGQELLDYIAKPILMFGAWSPSDLAFRPTIDVWATEAEAEKNALAVRFSRRRAVQPST